MSDPQKSNSNSAAEKSVGTPTATAEEVANLRAAQESEYGTYVALVPISFNGSPAYLAGDPVPVTNVERHGYLEQGLVAKINSKEGGALISALHQANAPTEVVDQGPPVSLGVQVPGTDK
jgi:hypothetical protein